MKPASTIFLIRIWRTGQYKKQKQEQAGYPLRFAARTSKTSLYDFFDGIWKDRDKDDGKRQTKENGGRGEDDKARCLFWVFSVITDLWNLNGCFLSNIMNYNSVDKGFVIMP